MLIFGLYDANFASSDRDAYDHQLGIVKFFYLHTHAIEGDLVARRPEDSILTFNNAYALKELIQLVWRSNVRRKGQITLYLPSGRIRGLIESSFFN